MNDRAKSYVDHLHYSECLASLSTCTVRRCRSFWACFDTASIPKRRTLPRSYHRPKSKKKRGDFDLPKNRPVKTLISSSPAIAG